jgi:AcrR family transcriptional regulator
MPPVGEKSSPPERILDVADALFYAHGIHAVGVDAIVGRAGTAKATLYARFGSKDQLVGAYLGRRGARWREHLLAEMERRASDPKERLLAVFDILGEWFAKPGYRGCPFINAAAELPEPDHPGNRAATEHRSWLRELFERLASEAKLTDPRELAEQLLMLYDAAMVTAYVEQDPLAAQRAKRIAAATMAPDRR